MPAVLEMDGKRVRQVLSNLIDNAAKFTRDGVLTLTADYAAPAPGESAGWLTLSVADTGCGIALEDRQHIFEPFQRLSAAESQPGVGLGLAIVQQWVQRMHGRIHVYSEVGQGTTIRVALPVREVDESRVSHHYIAAAAHVLPLLDGTGRRIWLAEDTPEIREFLVEELASLGFQVDSEADGLRMLARIQADDASRPDLILTDHRMEGADGSAVLAAARARWPDLPVVAVSATPQEAPTLDGGGYDASLLKPINLVELRHVLGRLLHLSTQQPASEAAPASASLPRLSRAELEQVQRLLDIGGIDRRRAPPGAQPLQHLHQPAAAVHRAGRVRAAARATAFVPPAGRRRDAAGRAAGADGAAAAVRPWPGGRVGRRQSLTGRCAPPPATARPCSRR